MANPTDPKQLDKRTAERYLRSGAVDEKAYQRHIESLPDLADKAVPVETVMHDELEDEDDDFDDEDEDEDEGDEDEDTGSDE